MIIANGKDFHHSAPADGTENIWVLCFWEVRERFLPDGLSGKNVTKEI